MPSELQSLPSLEGYLTIADGTPPAKVMIQPRGYEKVAERLEVREVATKFNDFVRDRSEPKKESGDPDWLKI